jgi:hypothetical protein
MIFSLSLRKFYSYFPATKQRKPNSDRSGEREGGREENDLPHLLTNVSFDLNTGKTSYLNRKNKSQDTCPKH